jgi:hypothetical protein
VRAHLLTAVAADAALLIDYRAREYQIPDCRVVLQQGVLSDSGSDHLELRLQ